MKKHHIIKGITFKDRYILINVDGKDYKIDISLHSEKLANSSLELKSNYVISPSGYGIHWPLIDEDLSIDALIRSDNYTKNTMTRV